MNEDQLSSKNEVLKRFKLSFEPEDIRYIIVKEENEIYPMINDLSEIKSKYVNREGVIEILSSRIITCKQILEDF